MSKSRPTNVKTTARSRAVAVEVVLVDDDVAAVLAVVTVEGEVVDDVLVEVWVLVDVVLVVVVIVVVCVAVVVLVVHMPHWAGHCCW